MSNKKSFVVVATGFEVTQTKNGHPQLVVDLRVVEGPEVGAEKTFYKVIMMDNPDSLKWAAESLRALGMTNDNPFKPEGLGSVKARCTEVMEEYKGKRRWKVKWINPIKGRKLEALDESKADEFAALFQEALASVEPVEVDERNAAPDEIPTAAQSNEPAATGTLSNPLDL